MANIEQLKGAFSTGVSYPNRYRITIPGFRQGDVYCQATNLPGRQITTNPRTIGMLTQKMPYGFIFDDVNLQFLLDGSYTAKKYFEDWQMQIYGENTYELSYKYGSGTGNSGGYTKDVVIEQLAKDSEQVIYGVKLKGAFPVTINPIELSDGATGQITQLNVQLAFTDWERSGKSGTGRGDGQAEVDRRRADAATPGTTEVQPGDTMATPKVKPAPGSIVPSRPDFDDQVFSPATPTPDNEFTVGSDPSKSRPPYAP